MSPKTLTSTKPARIRPDSKGVVYVTAVLVLLILIAAFSVSFAGQMTVGAWAGLTGLRQLAVPVAIDSVILVFSLAANVKRSRGESTRVAWVTVTFFTFVSMTFNVLHVIVPALKTGVTAEALIGGAVSGLMPLLILLATHMMSDLLVAPPLGTKEERRAVQEAADLGQSAIFESKLSRRKGTPERERALRILGVRLNAGEAVSAIAKSEAVDRSVIYAAKKEIEGAK
jgi:hypothetical protein